MASIKEIKRNILDNAENEPRSRHSLNQQTLHKDLDSERRFFGHPHKGVKAELKRARESL